jgi:PiT family inorganic phosphate transporter
MTMLMGLAIGWSIGANDAANSLGTAVGARVLSLRQAIVLIAIMGFLGAYLQGSHVIETIGKGILEMDKLDQHTAVYVALVSAFAGCAWVVLATSWRMPISTSHSIVGAVAGAGLAIRAPVHWTVMRNVFVCWIATPIGAALLSFVLYIVLKAVLYRLIPRRLMTTLLSPLIVVSGCYVAYTWGANDVANAVGVICGADILSVNASIALGGLAIVLGIMTWGYRVITTIGSGLVYLAPLMALSAQLASAINVHVYTLMGIPVSTSHSIVGAVVGVGLVRGIRVLNINLVREIVTCWVLTPFVSGAISFIALTFLHFFHFV